MKDCTTCKYGYEDERLGIPMCHHPKRFLEDCVDFNMHEEKEIEAERRGSSEKPSDQEPEVDLEKEMDRFFETMPVLEHENIFEDTFKNIARHFAEWGAEHAKIDVTDFCKPIDPGIAQCIADHSWEMLGEDEKPVPNDLEEAAEEKYPVYWKDYPKDGIARSESSYDTNKQCRDAFIAGAKWQKEQDDYDIIFYKGMMYYRKQMLEEAVEGEVYKFGEVAYVKECNNAELTKYLSRFNNGDKVKIIVIHETDIQ